MKLIHLAVFFCSIIAALPLSARANGSTSLIVSVPDQKLVIVQDGQRVAQFRVSTSRFGVGDRRRSYTTPLGTLEIASKIGANAPEGAVFKGRAMTGEILPANARGRDPIVTRILWLRGLEAGNARAFERGIYIHGTPVEREIGRPASYGCIRMKSKDVIRVFDAVPLGTRIAIVNEPVSRALADAAVAHHIAQAAAVAAN